MQNDIFSFKFKGAGFKNTKTW